MIKQNALKVPMRCYPVKENHIGSVVSEILLLFYKDSISIHFIKVRRRVVRRGVNVVGGARRQNPLLEIKTWMSRNQQRYGSSSCMAPPLEILNLFQR